MCVSLSTNSPLSSNFSVHPLLHACVPVYSLLWLSLFVPLLGTHLCAPVSLCLSLLFFFLQLSLSVPSSVSVSPTIVSSASIRLSVSPLCLLILSHYLSLFDFLHFVRASFSDCNFIRVRLSVSHPTTLFTPSTIVRPLPLSFPPG